MWEPQVWAVILKGTNFGIKPVQAHSIFLDFQLQVGRRAWAKFQIWADGLGLDISLDVIYFHFDLSIFGLFIMS